MVSGILDFGIGNSAQGIRNPTNDWNPERVRNPVPEIPWITLCGAKSSSGCLETSGRGDLRLRVTENATLFLNEF